MSGPPSPPSLLARLRAVNWQRLNYVLIPAARSRRPTAEPFGEPSSGGGRRLLRLYRALTPEGRWFVVVVPVTGALAVDVTHTQVYLLFSVLASVLLASLIVSATLRVPDLSLRVLAPPRVFVGAEVSFLVECERTSPGPSTARLRVETPFLPYFGRWLTRPVLMAAVGFGAPATAIVKARFSERGDLTLGRFRVSTVVPLGLASGPPVQSGPVRLRVVPRPANVLRLGIPLASRHQPGGVALASKTGESMDLRGVRPYRRGDRVRDLSARTWARTGKPAVREYQEEYFTRVGVVLDCVAPPRPSARDEEAFEAAVSLTAGIVEHLGRGDALVDLLVVGEQIHALTLGRSLGFLEQALDHLAVAEMEASVDRRRLLQLLAPHLSRLSAVVMVVDGWDETREEFVRGVEKTGARVHCVAVGDSVNAGARMRTASVASILGGRGVVL